MDSAELVYNRLIAPIEAKMTSIVGRIIRDENEAADVLQEVLAEVWGRLRRIDRHANPHAYILRICVSRSYDALRRRSARRRHHERFAAEKARQAVTNAPEEESALAEAVREAVAFLPARQAKAVMLRAMDNLTYDEIAEILGCAAATARSHFAKGRARVRDILARRGTVKLEEDTA